MRFVIPPTSKLPKSNSLNMLCLATIESAGYHSKRYVADLLFKPPRRGKRRPFK